MNKVDFTKNGGFPVTQNTLDNVQQAYLSAFAAMSMLIGNKVILFGVEKQGNSLTNGWVSIGGELFEFVGGVALSTLDIVEVSVSRQFKDNLTKPVYFTRQVKCVAGGQFLLADFKRPGTIANMTFAGEIKAYAGNVPPNGWMLCDGSLLNIADYPALFSAIGVNYGGDNITTFALPDLRGRVPVMPDGSADFTALGQYGGEKKHVLTIPELPSHYFNYAGDDQLGSAATNPLFPNAYDGGFNRDWSGDNGGAAKLWRTNTLGQNVAHNNIQPYTVVNYLIKY